MKNHTTVLKAIALCAALALPVVSAQNAVAEHLSKHDKQEKQSKADRKDRKIKLESNFLAGDFHQHTLYTDGSTTFDFVMGKDNENGLDWWANSEHGGERNRDGEGHYWDDPLFYSENPILGDEEYSGGHQEMWRWQSLRDFVFPDILRTRNLYPEKRIISGLEWNVPSHEHCSTGIVADDPNAISAFEYMFDASDDDTSREGESTPYGALTKTNGAVYSWVGDSKVISAKTPEEAHADAVTACAWMQEQLEDGLIDNGYIVFAHPERDGAWTAEEGGGYNIEHFRDFNNAGPDVCFGFEGAPGHQVNSSRGGFSSGAFGGTYGGAGYYTATMGGLWDALLGEGRHWFNFASSDYHRHYTAGGDDFYPGEYQKDYVNVVDLDADGEYSLTEIVDGMRSGNSFHVMGDLINELQFDAQARSRNATMGQTLQIRPGEDVTIKITFNSPSINNNGDTPVVDHIDLIAGDVTGLVDPESAEYSNPTNPSTRILKTFNASNWEVCDEDGSRVMVYHLKNVSNSMYFRLRGSNVPPCTEYETDCQGNPLADSLATENLGLDGAAEAYADLWFYSNPIFVQVAQ